MEAFLNYWLVVAIAVALMVPLYLVDGGQVKRAYKLALVGLFRHKLSFPPLTPGWWFKVCRKGAWKAKLVHLVSFFGLCFLASRALASVFSEHTVGMVILSWFLVTAFGFFTESLQSSANRGASLQDAFVNAVGAVVGGIIAFVYL